MGGCLVELHHEGEKGAVLGGVEGLVETAGEEVAVGIVPVEEAAVGIVLAEEAAVGNVPAEEDHRAVVASCLVAANREDHEEPCQTQQGGVHRSWAIHRDAEQHSLAIDRVAEQHSLAMLHEARQQQT